MTEEKNEIYEIKKENVKQLLTIIGGSFIGCFLSILLAGQLVKPKAQCPPPCAFMRPAHVQMHAFNHHKHHKVMRGEHKKFQQKFNGQNKEFKKQAIPAPKAEV